MADIAQTMDQRYYARMAGESVELPDKPLTPDQVWYQKIIEFLEAGGGGGGEGGTTNYNALTNKPSINGVTLSGNKTTAQLGISIPTQVSALTNDAGYVTSDDIDTAISGKADKSDVDAALADKVDAVTGKGLSTNDFTAAEKTKLEGIEAGAQANPAVATVSSNGLMSAADKASLNRIAELLRSAVLYRSVSGDPVAVTDAAAAPVQSLTVQIVPKQEADDKNLFVPTELAWCSDKGAITEDIGTVSAWIAVTPGNAYTISTAKAVKSFSLVFFTKREAGAVVKGTARTRIENATALSVTAPADAEYLYASVNPDGNPDGTGASARKILRETDTEYLVQVELGEARTGYALPSNIRPISGAASVTVTRTGENGSDPQSVAVSMGEAGTVYGGTLDALTGTLTVTYASFSVTAGSSVTKGPDAETSKGALRYYLALGTSIQRYVESRECYSNVMDYAATWGDLPPYCYYNERSDLRFGLPSAIATAADAKQWLIDHNARFVLPLATPVTYQLTPQSLSTLAGSNTIGADAGPVSVTYKVDTSRI